MTWPGVWHSIAQLGTVLLLVGVGYLAGRWHRHHHQDQVERDAWDDGFREALRSILFAQTGEDLDDLTARLDTAQEQTSPPAMPWMN